MARMPQETETHVFQWVCAHNGDAAEPADLIQLVLALNKDMVSGFDRVWEGQEEHMRLYHPIRRSTDPESEDHRSDREPDSRHLWVMWEGSKLVLGRIVLPLVVGGLGAALTLLIAKAIG